MNVVAITGNDLVSMWDFLGLFSITYGAYTDTSNGKNYCGEYVGKRDITVKKGTGDTPASKGWLVQYIVFTKKTDDCCEDHEATERVNYRLEAREIKFGTATEITKPDLLSGTYNANTDGSDVAASTAYYINNDTLSWLPTLQPEKWDDGAAGGRRIGFGGPDDLPTGLAGAASATSSQDLTATWNCCDKVRKTVGPTCSTP